LGARRSGFLAFDRIARNKWDTMTSFLRSKMTEKSNFEVIKIVQGELSANVIKAHLESEGIPVYLKYESAGIIYGITADGIGEVRILVPHQFVDEARKIIEPVDVNKPEEEQ
jgi:hypothetical protein